MSRDYADPNCPKCGGAGFIYPECLYTRPGEKGGQYCDCALDALRIMNMEQIWRSLSTAKDLPGLRANPPLKVFLEHNLWITASEITFKQHMKALAYSMSSMWDCRVYADSQLLDSWFGTQKAQGVRIYDLEIERSTLEAIDLPDLVTPPDLLVVLLGIKQLPNKEAPNALLETLGLRRHVGKPTWLVDQPDHRIDEPHHRFFSESLESMLSAWAHVKIVRAKMSKFRAVPVLANPVAQDVEIDAALEDPGQTEPDTSLPEGTPEDDEEDASEFLDERTAQEEEAERHTRNFLATQVEIEARQPKRPRPGKPWKRR